MTTTNPIGDPTVPRTRSVKPSADPPQQNVSEIYPSIAAASLNFGSLEKDAENPYFKSKYLSLAGLLKAVRPALADQGVMITSRYLLVPQGWVVETTLYHIPSRTSISSQFPVTETETVYAPDHQGKMKQVGSSGAQKVGASGTFGMRYNLLQLLGIAAEDDDGNSAGELANPADFLGPPPSGGQRMDPQRMPQPGLLPGPAWM